MSKPRFANGWYQTPKVSELRQEFQNIYDDVTTAEDDIDSLESGKVDNVGSVPGIIAGAADSTDADGNPTPNTTSFPAANYDEGTIFLATSYPSGVDGGSMQFRLESGAWVWRWGSFSADSMFSGTGSGKYQRFADRRQVCTSTVSGTANITTSAAGGFRSSGTPVTWSFPATFSAAPRVDGSSTNVNSLMMIAESAATTTDVVPVWWAAASASSVSVAGTLWASGEW